MYRGTARSWMPQVNLYCCNCPFLKSLLQATPAGYKKIKYTHDSFCLILAVGLRLFFILGMINLGFHLLDKSRICSQISLSVK